MAHATSHWTWIRACSACSGDYEDPERTARSDARQEEGDEEASEGNGEKSASREEFPVREK
jgi:hypothetical protein